MPLKPSQAGLSDSPTNEFTPLMEKEPPIPIQYFRVGLGCGWIIFGVIMACYFEGWNPLTGLYVIVQVITTTGYGDVVVTRQSSKVFCSFYVLGTVLIIGTFIIENADRVVSQHGKALRDQINRVKTSQSPTPTHGGAAPPFSAQNERPTWCSLSWLNAEVLASSLMFIAFVAFGTIFFRWYEECSCSYGVTAIQGCRDGPSCPETGGAVLTWVDSFYMSMVTLTSVGFGDHSPKTRVGRAIACVWMTFGIAATMNFCAVVGHLMLTKKKAKLRIGTVSSALFRKIDVNDDGELSRHEFLRYTLLKFGMAKEADLAEIDRLFDVIDTDGSNTVSYEEIENYCDT